MVNMSQIEIDKETLTNIAAFAVVIAYVAFLVIRPEYKVPDELKTIANLCIGFLFTGAGFNAGIRMVKAQIAANKKEG